MQRGLDRIAREMASALRAVCAAMSRSSPIAGLLLVAVALCLPLRAVAADAQTQAAEALYRQAKALMERGELDEACEKFAASHALEPGLGTLLYLGDCYERADRFASALDTFDAAAELAAERGDEARAHLASVRAKALGPRVPTLEIHSAESPPSDLLITVNGVPFDQANLNRPMPRDQGQYELRFSAPGRQSFVSNIELKNGAAHRTVIEVPHLVRSPGPIAADASTSDVVDDSDHGDGQRLTAWIVGGTGLALAITSGVLAALAAGKNEDSKASCNPSNPNSCGPDGVELRNDAKSMATWATVTGVLGGLGVAGGVVLYVSAPSSESGVPDSALLTLGGHF